MVPITLSTSLYPLGYHIQLTVSWHLLETALIWLYTAVIWWYQILVRFSFETEFSYAHLLMYAERCRSVRGPDKTATSTTTPKGKYTESLTFSTPNCIYANYGKLGKPCLQAVKILRIFLAKETQIWNWITDFYLWKLSITSKEFCTLQVSASCLALYLNSKTSPLYFRTLCGLPWWTNQSLYPIGHHFGGQYAFAFSTRSAYSMHAIPCELSGLEVHCLCIWFS